MKIIKIVSKKFGSKDLLIDDDDFDRASKRKWFLWQAKSGVLYAKTRYVFQDNPRKRVPIHRFIMKITDPNVGIDHIDRNPLNNQKANLRIASKAENARNSFNIKRNKTEYKGVSIVPSGRFQVSLRLNKIKTYVGTFDTPEEAARKYNELARQYHGEFAYQNPV